MYYVDDMAQAQAFYRTVLGVEPRYESAEWTEFDLGDGSALCLHAVERGKRPTEGGVLVARVSDIHTVVTRLKGAGIEFVRDVHEVHPGAYSADFRDAEGNMVSLYALEEG
jgi:catechol 2,3-dioxygenase-like lactoylglutathione lyase family enzyme